MKTRILIALLFFATCFTISAQSLTQTDPQTNKEFTQKADYALDQAAYMQSEDHKQMIIYIQLLKEKELKAKDAKSDQDGEVTPMVMQCVVYRYVCQSGYTWYSSTNYGTTCPFCGNSFAGSSMESAPCF